MGSLEIRPVHSTGDLRRFIRLPFRLYRDEPKWVAPLIFERRQFLDRRKNPFFEHGRAEYFLALRDGRPVGRITAQVDDNFQRFQGNRWGWFGFFECERDPEAAGALLDRAEQWLRGQGCDRMVGPADFTTNDECGVLVEGYDLRPMILEPWHPPYYRDLLESQGLSKRIDLLMWSLEMGRLKQGTSFHPMIHEAAEKAQSEHGVVLRAMRRNDLEAEVHRFMDIYNEAWGDNWGFVPITDAEVRFQAENLKPVLSEDWAMIAERNGEVLGAALTLPDINQVLVRMKGRLLPFGWLRFLLGRRKIDRIRVFALGVRPQHQHLGVAAALFVRHLEASAKTGIPAGEMGWILETNEPMNRAMEGMGGEVVKKYRLFELGL